MLSVLANRDYRRLFLAQCIALIGTGLTTVALGLLAFDLAGKDAGAVLGTALAIKMIAYVVVAPIAGAFAEVIRRKPMLIALDLVRAGVALSLPFVTEIWQIFVLIFVLQSSSAAFTPAFQATIPDILPDEKDYTNALSLSRLAYDLENLASPTIAALLLTVVAYDSLFFGTVVGFAASALFVWSALVPDRREAIRRSIWDRTTRGIRLYLATPRLRGLLAISLAVSAAGSMAIVNTVVIVRGELGLDQRAVAWSLAAFGGGSMIAALAVPRLLDRLGDRKTMLMGAALLPLILALASGIASYSQLAVLWLVMGAGYAAAQLPGGRLIRRSAHEADRPSLFAAQFALSHTCWLVSYPLAGWIGARVGLNAAAFAMAGIALTGLIAMLLVWPREADVVEHEHAELPADHPHMTQHPVTGKARHRHAVIIDSLHPEWPRER